MIREYIKLFEVILLSSTHGLMSSFFTYIPPNVGQYIENNV